MTTECLTIWRNRGQDGNIQVRQQLLELLDTIATEQRWFNRAQYDFLNLTESTLPIRETESSMSSSTRNNSRSGANSNTGILPKVNV